MIRYTRENDEGGGTVQVTTLAPVRQEPDMNRRVPYAQSAEDLVQELTARTERLYETQPKMTLFGLFRLIAAAMGGHPIHTFKL